MSRARVIFNPTADRGRASRVALDVRRRLQEMSATVEWHVTESPRHATTLAQEAIADGCKLVVAAGGDGTVNEVVNGLMRAGRPDHPATLGVIPMGSGNDFAWLAGVSLNPLEACRRVFDGRTRVVDVGYICQADGRARYFHNGCGIGFDAQVALEVQRLKRWRGFVMYLVGVLRTLVLHHQAPRLRIRLDGREMERATMMLTLGNGQRHGGGFLVTPDAELDDGLLDVCLAGELSRLGMLLVIPRFVRGTHVTHKQVHMARARHVAVESPVPWPIHLDGEVFATDARQFEVTVIPGALRVRT